MAKPLTPTQKKQIAAKKSALSIALRGNPNPDVESLARSYGLPVADVQYEIRRMENAT